MGNVLLTGSGVLPSLKPRTVKEEGSQLGQSSANVIDMPVSMVCPVEGVTRKPDPNFRELTYLVAMIPSTAFAGGSSGHELVSFGYD